MAQQDKTDWYWNGVLAGAVNNLYYDFINVDVCHVPYATNHRNSSFFLKTRLAYSISQRWATWEETSWFEVTDIKILWDEDCKNVAWNVYAMWKKDKIKAIFAAPISSWCVWRFFRCTQDDMIQSKDCWDWKLFVTDYVTWKRYMKDERITSSDEVLEKISWTTAEEVTWLETWIQINEYNLWTTLWLFSDENVENWYAQFKTSWAVSPWNYLLVYHSRNLDGDWFSWQVRMITWVDSKGRITVDSPWLWFKVPEEGKEVTWYWVSYAIFDNWWEVIWFTNNKDIEIMYAPWDCRHMAVYNQDSWWLSGSSKWKIIWVADANNKIFILTQNGYIHYNKDSWWYNKFFINDDMFAWVDKISITAYRDMVLAFWRKHISLWVPDEQNRFWTMYNQSASIWLWSRYSFTEYDWDLVLVSNDKRLLTLTIQSAWRYWLTFDDVWAQSWLNWKLSALRPWDEVFIWNDNNNLRVFCNVSYLPYEERNNRADIRDFDPTSTHIYKFDTLFKVWSEDHVNWHLIKWATEWVYFWEDWIYIRDDAVVDCWDSEYNARISAYLIENESNWEWVNSALANRPKLYNLAKLNRLITTLWPGVYSNGTKIKITNYSKWIGYTYEFPVSWDWNTWLWLMTSYYLNEWLTREEEEKIECMLSVLQDSQIQYQPNCPEEDVMRQYIAQNSPWCEDYDELITESHWVCINDKIYELAPTMPLVTDLWENQDYCTQIKLELIWWKGDIICFGWRLAEMFTAPLFTIWPDWEYQLQPNTDCE